MNIRLVVPWVLVVWNVRPLKKNPSMWWKLLIKSIDEEMMSLLWLAQTCSDDVIDLSRHHCKDKTTDYDKTPSHSLGSTLTIMPKITYPRPCLTCGQQLNKGHFSHHKNCVVRQNIDITANSVHYPLHRKGACNGTYDSNTPTTHCLFLVRCVERN